MIRNKITFLAVAVILMLIVIAGAILFYFQKLANLKNISSFEECVSAGYSILESYPQQCVTPDGKKFVENTGNIIEKASLIKVSDLLPNQTVTSPVTIEGMARGFWFFEGSFPINILDGEGNIISQSVAISQKNWMTNDFVPFKAVVEFSVSSLQNGTIIFQKDNPSGLEQNDDQLIIPIKLSS